MNYLFISFFMLSSSNVCEVDGVIVEAPTEERQTESISFNRDSSKSYSIYWVHKGNLNKSTAISCFQPRGDARWDFVSQDRVTGIAVPEQVVKTSGACVFNGNYSLFLEYYVCECKCQKICRCRYLEELLYGKTNGQ